MDALERIISITVMLRSTSESLCELNPCRGLYPCGMPCAVISPCTFSAFAPLELHCNTIKQQCKRNSQIGRGDRMKQAKAEAAELIDAYRGEKQAEFNNMVLSKGGSEGSASQKLQTETNKEIQELQAEFQKNAQKAVDVLLSKCCEVSLEVPTARVRSTQKMYGMTRDN